MPGIRPRAVCLDGKKTCSKCKEHKDLDQFFKYHRGKFGRFADCKLCVRKRVRASYLKNPESRIKRNKKNLQGFKQRKYGLSEEQIKKILEDQKHLCVICKISLDNSEPIKVPHIDHCHTKGHVRGILCTRCNKGLGNFKDNIEYLEAAINYLKERA